MSDLPEPLDIPMGVLIDRDAATWWPEYEDHAPGMTLEEVAEVMGVTRERVRQIEAVALAKLQRLWRQDDAKRAFQMHVDYLKKHRLVPLAKPPPRRKPRAGGLAEKSIMGNPALGSRQAGHPRGVHARQRGGGSPWLEAGFVPQPDGGVDARRLREGVGRAAMGLLVPDAGQESSGEVRRDRGPSWRAARSPCDQDHGAAA
jgi:transcriptional regulator with XRE-family HTH domain